MNENAIDRNLVSAFIDGLISDDGEREKGLEYIKSMPPVTPQPKTGHWIDDNENEIDAQYGRHLYKCSECNEYADMFVGGTEDWWDLEKPNYCPNCGAKMIEPQESEVDNG
jgi:DNA-directed RNA polymerase subunit RPC12/RpoP